MKTWPIVLGGFLVALSIQRRFRAPLACVVVTSPFGPRLVDGVTQHHNGVDLRAAVGTPVLAIADGVVRTGWNARSGNYALLHIDGARDLVAGYAHLSGFTVAQGQRVTAGQVIGLAGDTGNARGSHLHFTIRLDGDTVNPAQFVRL